MPLKGKYGIAIAALLLLSIALFLILTGEERGVKKWAVRYIEGMRERDFNTVFDLHAPSQRRVALAKKTPAAIESQITDIKMIYNDQKDSFEQAQPTSNLIHVWSEKFLLIKDMYYKITAITMKEDIENPSLPIKKRVTASVEVEVEYTNKESAPDLDGRVRRATYLLKMVHSRNVAKTWEEKSQKNRWLFDSITIKEGSLNYW